MRDSTDCPKCGRSIMNEYDAYCSGAAMEDAILPKLTPQEVKQYKEEDTEFTEAKKWIKIVDSGLYFDGNYSGTEWTVECKCPDCGTEWFFEDSSV